MILRMRGQRLGTTNRLPARCLAEKDGPHESLILSQFSAVVPPNTNNGLAQPFTSLHYQLHDHVVADNSRTRDRQVVGARWGISHLHVQGQLRLGRRR